MMNNNIEKSFEIKFVKDRSNRDMLESSLKSEELDKSMTSILKRFFLLPLTPWQSCSGHTKEDNPDELDMDHKPHLSIVEDEKKNEQESNLQKLFRAKLPELENSINTRYGQEVLKISIEEDENLKPKPYTIWFTVTDHNTAREDGRQILNIIWEEFFKYISKFDHQNLPLPNFENGNVFIKVNKK